MKNFKIEVGKFYKTRGGDIVKCIDLSSGCAYMRKKDSQVFSVHKLSGVFSSIKTSHLDIISEWERRTEVKVIKQNKPKTGQYGIVHILQAGTKYGVIEIRGNLGERNELVDAKDLREAASTLIQIAEIWESNEQSETLLIGRIA